MIVVKTGEIINDDKKGTKQLEAAYMLNLEARIKVIQKCIQNRVN